MTIKEVEALEEFRRDAFGYTDAGIKLARIDEALMEALAALRAEAWRPIEDAERSGAKDGREIALFRIDYWVKGWWDADYQCWMCHEGEIKPSRFRFITTPEAQ